jgi:F0F1-type ATP synthase membrane subunit c/vacuolar-type H+-ATPase subunit K
MVREVVDLKPNYLQDGSVLYGEAPLPSTEDVTVKLNDGTVVTVINGIVTVTLPNGYITQETLPNKGLGDAATTGSIMTTTGGVIASVPLPPWAQVIGGIIAGAGALIKAFSNGRAAQAANKAAYNQELINQQLQSQNSQLDTKIIELDKAITQAKQALQLKGLDGLGWCLINCAKTQAQERLKTASQIGEELVKGQDARVAALQKLTAEAQRLFVKQRNINFLYIGTGVLVVGALAYLVVKKL